MKKNQMYLIIGIVSLVIIIAGVGLYTMSQNTSKNDSGNYGSTKTTTIEISPKSKDSSEQTMMNSSTSSSASTSTSSMVANTDTSSVSKVTIESGYTTYNVSKLSNAQYGKVILFFHANWCPSCRGLDADIKSNISSIPNDTLILKVDYDSSSDLKSKYKITSQHTLVQVNQNGDLIKSSPGLYQLNTLNSVLKTF